jgi:hypothetical protein
MQKLTMLSKSLFILPFFLVLAMVVGEVKCIIKVFQCNWEPIGKAEILYTVSAVTGLGAIVGYIDIEDK